MMIKVGIVGGSGYGAKVFMLSIYLAHLELRIVKYMKHITKKLLQHKMI